MDKQRLAEAEEKQPLPSSLTEIPGTLIAMNPPQEDALPLDAAVVRRAIAHDREAFTQLFYQTYRYVYVVVSSVLSDDEDRHDAVQEVYARVWEGIVRLRAPEAFLAWLRTIARNCAVTVLRKKAPYTPMESEEKLDEDTFLYEAVGRDVALDIRAVLSSLPEEQARLLVLVYYDNMKLSEIARMWEMPQSTVRNRFRAAKKALLTALKERGIDRAVYGRGDLMSAIGTAIRDAVGTAVLSTAVAQDILDAILKQKEAAPLERVAAKMAVRRRNAAILRIASLVVLLSLAVSAATVGAFAWLRGGEVLPTEAANGTAANAAVTTSTSEKGMTDTTTTGTSPADSTTLADDVTASATTGTLPQGTTVPNETQPTKVFGTTSAPAAVTTTVPFVADVDPDNANVQGNAYNNVRHLGAFLARQDNWLYFSTAKGAELYKCRLDGGDAQCLYTGGNIRSINVVGDWIYFLDGDLYRIRTDGEQLEKLSTQAMAYLYVWGDVAYFQSGDWLYAMTLSARNVQRVAESSSHNPPYLVGYWTVCAAQFYPGAHHLRNTAIENASVASDVRVATAHWTLGDKKLLYLDRWTQTFYTLDITNSRANPVACPLPEEKADDEIAFVTNVDGGLIGFCDGTVYSLKTGDQSAVIPFGEAVTGIACFGRDVYYCTSSGALYHTTTYGEEPVLLVS